MTAKPHRPRTAAHRARTLAAAGLLILGAIGTGTLDATAASAETLVNTLQVNVPESLAPYLSSTVQNIPDTTTVGVEITCYVTGETVNGPLGSEDIWDLVSSVGPDVADGTFVPDADLDTGSYSPVVPHCSTVLGYTIGNGPVIVRSGPGGGYTSVGNSLSLGEYIEISCYSYGQTVPGPYGSENVWDQITEGGGIGGPGEWVPDALVYTGSNSAVVPHC